MATRDVQDWLTYLGHQLRNKRLQLNMKQDELAKRVGVSEMTISNLELGKGSSLATFVKVADALKEGPWLERLAPGVAVSPKQMFIKGHERKRAS
jgi:transcriptional regulator with XRE-family HTH domain